MIILVESPFEEYELVERLEEAKGFPALTADDIRQAALDAGVGAGKGRFLKRRRADSARASRKFKELVNRVRGGLLGYTDRFLRNEISRTRWMEWVKFLLRDAYQQAFAIGFESSGATSFRTGVSKVDEQWVKTAVQHEMRYFNRFLSQIVSSKRDPDALPQSPIPIKRESPKEIIARRMESYIDTLRHVYYAGRVMGTPTGMVIDWISPLDRKTCKGCRFLATHSPYTKKVLPSTPRAGDTKCLSNCRCRLIIRDVGGEEAAAIEKAHKSKEWYRRKLARLKAGMVL